MSYIRELRPPVGPRPIVMVGAAALVQDGRAQVQLDRRVGSGLRGIPGGALELGASLTAAARRGPPEETGLATGKLASWDVFSEAEVYDRCPHEDEVHNVSVVDL